MNELVATLIYVPVFVILILIIIACALVEHITKRLKHPVISVKIIHLDSEPLDTTNRIKPPTIHLSDAEIKLRRQVFKEARKEATLPPK